MSVGKEWYGKRSRASIPIATNSLIVCCGEETEKNYFDGVIDFIKKRENNRLVKFFNEVDAVDPLGMAKNVRKRVEAVERENHCKMDHVWVLFDKDDFMPENFNNAVEMVSGFSGNGTQYHALWSNQCFELWLLLNFINMQSAISRENYIEKLEIYLREKYRKNDKNIFGKIERKGGNIANAIRYAKALTDSNFTPANNDPATKVYEFFEHYGTYLGLWE